MTAPPRGSDGGRRRVSITGIVLAVVFLAVAAVGLSGDPFWLLSHGILWAAAGALALLGLGLLASTLPGIRSRGRE